MSGSESTAAPGDARSLLAHDENGAVGVADDGLRTRQADAEFQMLEQVEDSDRSVALQGTIARSGEILLLTLDAREMA